MNTGNPFILGSKGQRSGSRDTKNTSLSVFRRNAILTFAARFSLRHVSADFLLGFIFY